MRGAAAMCREKIGIDEASVLAFEEAPSVEEASSERILKCYMHCWMVEIGLMRETDMLYRKFLHSIDELPKGLYTRFLKLGYNCYSNSTDGCEKAYLMLSCWKQNSPEDFFIY